MKEINLEELLNEISNINLDEDGTRIYYLWEVKKFAKVLYEKVLDLVVENAKCTIFEEINPESILQIKDWIK